MMAKLAMTLNADYGRVTVVQVFLYPLPSPFSRNNDNLIQNLCLRVERSSSP